MHPYSSRKFSRGSRRRWLDGNDINPPINNTTEHDNKTDFDNYNEIPDNDLNASINFQSFILDNSDLTSENKLLFNN